MGDFRERYWASKSLGMHGPSTDPHVRIFFQKNNSPPHVPFLNRFCKRPFPAPPPKPGKSVMRDEVVQMQHLQIVACVAAGPRIA